MKVRKFKIIIVESQEEGLKGLKKRLVENWNAASARKPYKDDYDLILTLIGISSLGKIFSPQRIRILQAIREQKPESIYRLAKILNRAENNVRKDVQDLAKYGIIKLKKVRKKGQKKECLCPQYKWDGFDIAV
jgi:predicted transcriptional regulator